MAAAGLEKINLLSHTQEISRHPTFQEFQQFIVLIRALDSGVKNFKIHLLHVYLSAPPLTPHWKWKVKVKVARSCPTLCNPIGYKSMEFSRPEYWSGLPFPSPVDLPNPGIEPRSPTLQADSLPDKPQGKPLLLTAAAAAATSLQSCLTLCDPIDGSPPGSSEMGLGVKPERWSQNQVLVSQVCTESTSDDSSLTPKCSWVCTHCWGCYMRAYWPLPSPVNYFCSLTVNTWLTPKTAT